MFKSLLVAFLLMSSFYVNLTIGRGQTIPNTGSYLPIVQTDFTRHYTGTSSPLALTGSDLISFTLAMSQAQLTPYDYSMTEYHHIDFPTITIGSEIYVLTTTADAIEGYQGIINAPTLAHTETVPHIGQETILLVHEHREYLFTRIANVVVLIYGYNLARADLLQGALTVKGRIR